MTYDDVAFGPKPDPEVIKALHDLRELAAQMRHDRGGSTGAQMAALVDILDNAKVFQEIDEATGYDINLQPERVSRCTCGRSRATTAVPLGEDMHAVGCPGDPAEWGDMAFSPQQLRTMPAYVERAQAQVPADDATLAGYSTKEELHARIAAGVEQARRGETHDRGDFSQHLGEAEA